MWELEVGGSCQRQWIASEGSVGDAVLENRRETPQEGAELLLHCWRSFACSFREGSLQPNHAEAAGTWPLEASHSQRCECSVAVKAEQRWKCLFGDAGVAYAPPGTGWAVEH